MEFDKIVDRKLKGMAVRVLSYIEDTLGIEDIEDSPEDAEFGITAGMLKQIRSEILNATGETSRSIGSLKTPSSNGKISLSKEILHAISKSLVDMADAEDSNDTMPFFEVCGDLSLLRKIRNYVGAGVVYNNKYICCGVEDIIKFLIPILDSVSLAGIKVANGYYKSWRDNVCDLYLQGLGDE